VEVSDVFFGTKGTGNKEKKGPDVRVVTSYACTRPLKENVKN
jgi:hypothetical protein